MRCPIAIPAVLTIFVLHSRALAQQVYHANDWTVGATGGTDVNGYYIPPVCIISKFTPDGSRSFQMSVTKGLDSAVMTFTNNTWNWQYETPEEVIVRINGTNLFDANVYGIGSGIQFSMSMDDYHRFEGLLVVGTNLRAEFPQLNEPVWVIDMATAAPAFAAMDSCVADIENPKQTPGKPEVKF